MLINPYVFSNYTPSDGNAADYVAAVEAADGNSLEIGVKQAINSFVLGCKSDGIWTSLKASCILAGARTLNGCLVPLTGPAPSSNGFVSTDYNRKTGLKGNASSKYINSNRSTSADPLNSFHLSVYISAAPTISTSAFMGAEETYRNTLYASQPGNTTGIACRDVNVVQTSQPISSLGLFGATRTSSSGGAWRGNSVSGTYSSPSNPDISKNILVYCRANTGSAITSYTDARLAFYSIGESLDLTKLDSRVTSLINALAAAIP